MNSTVLNSPQVWLRCPVASAIEPDAAVSPSKMAVSCRFAIETRRVAIENAPCSTARRPEKHLETGGNSEFDLTNFGEKRLKNVVFQAKRLRKESKTMVNVCSEASTLSRSSCRRPWSLRATSISSGRPSGL